MVTTALERVAGLYELCHFPIELITSSFLLGFHDLLVDIKEGDILHVLLVTPFATALPRNILSVAGLMVIDAGSEVFSGGFND